MLTDSPSPGADTAQITVIIPTVADDRRAATIWRAIESAGPRSGAHTRVLVVVNGMHFSPALLAQLRASPGVDCLYFEQGNLPLALKSGREAVRSEYFAFIDDDDEFLPGGLARRIEALQARPDAAFLVSQGWFHSAGCDQPQTGLSAAAIKSDPLGCLLQENWVATSASGLYRTDRITPEDFTGMPSYLEWTYMGFRLLPRHPFVFIDTPTYRRHDMPGSVSKSADYCRGMVSALSSILRLDLPPATRQGLRRKLGSATHDLSVMSLERGERREAWCQHLRSLALPGGWHYLSYTRRLLYAHQPSA